MSEVEIHTGENQVIIHSNIITYGNAATGALTESIREEIETLWNEPNAVVNINGYLLTVVFRITATLRVNLQPLEIYRNTNGRNNFIRIEGFSSINISFVDGIGCNSGYFFIENLYKGSTTAAHEFEHTIGLDHPRQIDIRGAGRPGIMYPRGTLVDPEFQYDPKIPAGITGGTMHPIYRRVMQGDIDNLQLHKLQFKSGKNILGDFTNVYHSDHAELR